jgi:hypothetical protein
MSESNQTIVRYVPEVTYGVTPTDDPGWKPLLINSEGLNVGPVVQQSQRIRGTDRMPADLKKTNVQTGGPCALELSFGDFDDFIEAAMYGTWATDVVTVGTDQKSFTIEKEFGDLTSKFIQLKGCRVGQLDLSFAVDAIVTGQVVFAGATGLEAATSLVGAGSEASPSGNEIMAGNVDMDSVTYDGTSMASSGIIPMRIDLSINNNLRPNYSLLSADGPVDQKAGTAQIGGVLECYLADESWEIYQDMLGNTAVSLAWTITDSTGKGYTFTIPKVKLSGPAPAAGGLDQDNMIRADWVATETACTITRIP